MGSIHNADASELIVKLAEELKKIEGIKAPAWATFCKTGVHKERPPVDPEWWYARAASVLRKVFLLGPIGVSKLRTLYGGKKHRGYAPEVFRKGSGNILRKVLQQLEKAELVKKGEKGVHKGRIITPKGIKLLDRVSKQVEKTMVEKKTAEEKMPKETPAVEEPAKSEGIPKESPKEITKENIQQAKAEHNQMPEKKKQSKEEITN